MPFCISTEKRTTTVRGMLHHNDLTVKDPEPNAWCFPLLRCSNRNLSVFHFARSSRWASSVGLFTFLKHTSFADGRNSLRRQIQEGQELHLRHRHRLRADHALSRQGGAALG